MIERLGCEMEQVWLTLAFAALPMFLVMAIPEDFRWIILFSAVASLLVPFAPYSVTVKETGLTISSIASSTSINWSDIAKVQYNNPCRLMIIKTENHYAVIPFGIWFHTRASDSFFMLLDYVNKKVPPFKVKASNLI